MSSSIENPALTATQLLRQLRAGSLDCETVVKRCLAAIEERDRVIKAFTYVDKQRAIDAARSLDRGSATGLLHGVPVGVKDVFETEDMPTEYNSPHYSGHRSSRDAAAVGVLKAEGAIILGKTATVEFASLGRVAATTNPHDPQRTPGGTSSGSAAAVAAGMVPIALATQTGGSTIRPASFCGVAAMKPTFGTVSTDGMRPYAPSLDTVSWMARSVDDLALLSEALRVAWQDACARSAPMFGIYRTPYWKSASEDTRTALVSAAERLRAAGATVTEVQDPAGSHRLNEAQDVIMHGEGRAAYLNEYLRWPGELAPAFKEEVENAKGITSDHLRWAYDYLAEMRVLFDEAMSDFDGWLTPAAPGEAPLGLASTGDAVFNRLWTGLHTPAITIPGFTGSHGLPIGVQLVARRFADASLLAAARFAEAAIASN